MHHFCAKILSPKPDSHTYQQALHKKKKEKKEKKRKDYANKVTPVCVN